MTLRVSVRLCAFGVEPQRKDDALAALLSALGAEDVQRASADPRSRVITLRVTYLTEDTEEQVRATVRHMRNRVFFSNDSLVLSILRQQPARTS